MRGISDKGLKFLVDVTVLETDHKIIYKLMQLTVMSLPVDSVLGSVQALYNYNISSLLENVLSVAYRNNDSSFLY